MVLHFTTVITRLLGLLESNDPSLVFLVLGRLPTHHPPLPIYGEPISGSDKTVAGCVLSFFGNCAKSDKSLLVDALYTNHGIKKVHFCNSWPGDTFLGLLNTNTTLKYLVVTNNLRFNTLLEPGSNFQINNNTLELLFVSDIHPTPSHWGRCLGAVFTGATALNSLIFHNIQISEEKMLEIGDALAANTMLTTLTLIRCKLTDVGFVHIARAMRTNSKITHLNLSYNNDVTSKGIVALGHALVYNSTLRALSLKGIPHTERGITALTIGFTYHPSLVDMKIQLERVADYMRDATGYNTIFDLSVRNMLNTEKRNTTFTDLLVGGPRPPNTRSRIY